MIQVRTVVPIVRYLVFTLLLFSKDFGHSEVQN